MIPQRVLQATARKKRELVVGIGKHPKTGDQKLRTCIRKVYVAMER